MLIRSTKNTVAAIMVLAAATVWAQSSSPASTPGGVAGNRPVASRKSTTGNKTVNPAASGAMHQRLDEMEGTLNKMHALLKQMRAKAAANGSNSLAKANLDMWELMVGELDNQLQQLKAATLSRDDFEARRAAMYKSASDKADAAAAQARQAMAAGSAEQETPAASGDQHAPAGQAQPPAPATPSAATK